MDKPITCKQMPTKHCIELQIDEATIFGRVKVALWNFVLPPHIRLVINKGGK